MDNHVFSHWDISRENSISLSLSLSLSPPPSQQLSSLAGCQPVSGSAGDPNAGLLKLSHILPHVYHRLPHSGTETRRHAVLAARKGRADTVALHYGIWCQPVLERRAKFRKTQQKKTAEDTWFQAHCQRTPEWKGHSLKCQALVIGEETSAWEAAVWC